ncbi:hypothetical protein BDU57DRAFT_530799 [Ampelomyces quisqualis]|uniref:RING-type domain-containing protein n=1 Tax=Ampelomyces quisqualis TaxID=50730 RepID=A0A6A5QJN1_AMPQU|nr:hypothetical protein BDU57DRAFT_530799 [Ampelomyces quisqualis]
MPSQRNIPAPDEAFRTQLLETYTSPRKPTNKTNVDACAICLEPQDCKTLPSITISSCSHTFHHACIYEWTAQNSTCPYCRQEMFVPREIVIPFLGGDFRISRELYEAWKRSEGGREETAEFVEREVAREVGEEEWAVEEEQLVEEEGGSWHEGFW